MEPIEIKIKMLRLGLKQTQIAKKVGVTRRAIGMTIDGHSASHRLRVAIAEAIGIDIKEIWPSVYTTGGPRGKGRPKKDQSRI